MKTTGWSLALSVFFLLPVHADLTIAYSTTVQPASQSQKAEGTGAATNMTIKIKGDKARIEASPQLTTIFDGTTGEVINLMNDQKTVVRISPEKMKAVTDMLNKFSSKKPAPEKRKLTPTGSKEMVNGYETEQYTYDGPDFKAIYWVAPSYPDGTAITTSIHQIRILGRCEYENAGFPRFSRAAHPDTIDHGQRCSGKEARCEPGCWSRHRNHEHHQFREPESDQRF